MKVRMTSKSGLQSRQEGESLFAQGGQIAANPAKSACTPKTAETARDLLLDLDHAQIAFGEIVVKIHAKIFQKAEDGFLVFAQAVEQISGGTLFASALFPRWGSGPGSDEIPLIQQAEKLGFPSDHFQWMQPVLSFNSCLFCRCFHFKEQFFEIGCPDGFLFFCQKHQITQEMNEAESMLAPVQEVRTPSIMDGDSSELRQNPDRFQRLLTTALIDVIVGECLCAGVMHPIALAQDRQPCFILVDDFGLDQCFFDLLLDVCQIGGIALDQGADGPFAHLDSQEIQHDLCCSRQGHQLLVHQIHRNRSDRRPILDGSSNLLGKTSSSDVLAN